VLVFLAHWCPHCQNEVPKLVEWIAADGIPADVEVVAVSTAVQLDRGNPPRAWLAGEGWPVTAVRDDDTGTVADAYGLRSFPYVVVVGTDGRVRARLSGGLRPRPGCGPSTRPVGPGRFPPARTAPEPAVRPIGSVGHQGAAGGW